MHAKTHNINKMKDLLIFLKKIMMRILALI